MRRLCTQAFALIFALLAGAAPVRAEGEADEDQADRDRQARNLFYLGEEHYSAGRYQKAAMLYEESYALSKRPELLFNLGNAYERNGEYGKAADYLRRYLRSGRANNVAAIKQRIDRLEQRVEEQRREREQETARLMAERQRQREETENKESGASTTQKIGYISIAVGGAGLVSAVVFGVASLSAGKDANKSCTDTNLCSQNSRGALERQKRFAILADVSTAVGVASAGVGAYLLWRAHRDRKEKEEETSNREVVVTPEVFNGGIGLGISGDF
jgi:tetratricopeptide (TPR) repeat protein